MLYHFFSVNQKSGGCLFQNLKIWKEEKYQKLQGTYPVIFLSFELSEIQGVWDLLGKYEFKSAGVKADTKRQSEYKNDYGRSSKGAAFLHIPG